ncbi:adenylate/guanylate cyclase domain-containing protein [Pseudoduganella ginsengisoli]|uniref:adenylate/guanylate cyclase domain-containing protein n=1 Tax=Pseudoduganella ginsengisoli TaxID=1462440 RepID=UPI0014781A72
MAAWAGAQHVSGVMLLEDPSGTMTLPQVLDAERAGRFRAGDTNVGMTTSAFWMRFTIPPYPHAPGAAFWFDTGNRTLQEIALYQPDGHGGWRHAATGSTQPFAQRPLPTDQFVFPITLQQGADTVLYLRVRSTAYMGIIVQPRIWQPQAYMEHMEWERTGWHIYLGMAASLAGFYLMLWLYLREIDHLLYVLSLASIVFATCSALGGYGAAYALYWPDAPRFEQSAWVGAILAAGLFPVLFITRLADLWRRLPRLNLTLRWLVILNTVVASAILLVFWLHPGTSAALQQQLFIVGWLVWQPIFPLVLSGVVYVAWRGDRMARFILVAYLPAVMASAWTSVENLRGMPPTLSLLMWGAAFELLVMALALADRFHCERLDTFAARQAMLNNLRQSEQELERKVMQRTLELNAEQKRTKELLYNILPVELADELSATGRAQPARHESATVLFTDFAGFTALASTMPADRMIAELNDIFAAFDDIADECGIEKIKTIGDAYMAAAGLPKPCADHAQRCVRAGMKMIAYVEQRNHSHAFKWTLRVGIHSGPVVAGVVGKRKYAFDIWGDTVNIASRMESAGAGMKVNVSAYTSDLAGDAFQCEYRGKVAAKGKGDIDMYFVVGERTGT